MKENSRDTEFAPIGREMDMSNGELKIEIGYDGLQKGKCILKKQYDELEREKAEETNRRIELEEKYRVCEEQNEGLRKKIGEYEAQNGKSRNGGLFTKINGFEKEKKKVAELLKTMQHKGTEMARREREVRKENERLLERVKALEKERAEAENSIKFLEKSNSGFMAQIEEEKKAYLILKYYLELAVKHISYGTQIIAQFPFNFEDVRVDYRDMLKGRPNTNMEKSPPATAVININGSEDVGNRGTRPPTGLLKRKRDSSGISKPSDKFAKRPVEQSPLPLSTGGNGTSSASSSKSAAKWEFEVDMLMAFEKDPVLTMQAICALYRQHKSRRTMSYDSAPMYTPGFYSLSAFRGIALAMFLVDGDPNGIMKKTMEELKTHDPLGLKDCRMIAHAHSRQLFEIYKSGQDPFFGPN